MCEVATVAKRDLEAGKFIDGLGGFMAYGVIENAEPFSAEDHLPKGVAEGCRLVRAVVKDSPISYADVELPPGRLCDLLLKEQRQRFSGG